MERGFEIYSDVVSQAECGDLIEALCGRPSDRNRAGRRHLMNEPMVHAIAHDDRLVSIARLWVGGDSIPFRATLFEKSGIANWLVMWHQDTALPLSRRFDSADWGPWSIKEGIHYAHAPSWALERTVALRIHLDQSNEFNGSLRVIPKSHSSGVLDDGAVFEKAHRTEFTECHVGRGGVLAMRPLLIHASSKAKRSIPRRVLHIEYADSLHISENMELAIA
jgi:ectoine hydroxylase-related dioxygenase (phytanoyl-CoA dioxygenase family)